MANLALVRAVLQPDDAKAWASLQSAARLLSQDRSRLEVTVPGSDAVNRAITDRGLLARAAAIS